MSTAGEQDKQDARSLDKSPEPDVLRQRLTLVAVLVAVVVVPTSISGSGVALPAIGTETGADLTQLQWVVNAFNLAFGCFTLAWGSVADIVGRARAFTAGATLYALGSLASALAPNVLILDGARAVAGIGGAAIFACGSAILSTVFTGPARAKAFALFGTVAGIGVALGPSFSGLMVGGPGWRWMFAVHTILLALVLCVTPVIRNTVAHTAQPGARIDVPGTTLFVAAMLALTVGIVQGASWGWTSPAVLALFGVAIVLFVVFVGVEARVARPMLDLAVVRDSRFIGMCLITVCASFGFVTLLTYLPIYLTVVGGRSSSAAGLIMVLLTLPVLVCPMLAGRLVARGVSPGLLLRISLACFVVGDLALLVMGPGFSVLVVAVPLLVIGAGMGISTGLLDGQAIGLVNPARAGMAAGFLNTLRLGSEAIAVAVYASVLATLVHSSVADGITEFASPLTADGAADRLAGGDLAGATAAAPGDPGFASFLIDAYDSAFHTMQITIAAVCAALGAFIVVMLRKRPNTA